MLGHPENAAFFRIKVLNLPTGLLCPLSIWREYLVGIVDQSVNSTLRSENSGVFGRPIIHKWGGYRTVDSDNQNALIMDIQWL